MARTLRVFEHQTVRVGEPLRAADGTDVALTVADFDALVRYNSAHGDRFFVIGHKRIRFGHYVGYLQVGQLGIEVLPKADNARVGASDGARWRDGLLRMIEVAGGLRLEDPGAANQRTAPSTLAELVAARLAEETERLLHHGLAKGYRDAEDNGPTFRGRLLVSKNLRENLVRADRFYVRNQEYDRDIQVNRIVYAALQAIRQLPLSASTTTRADACNRAFPAVDRLRVVPGLFERIRLGRSTSRYRDALVLAQMILEHHSPELRAGRSPVFALLFDMNVLWERYVAALFRSEAGKGTTVSCQESSDFWKPVGERTRRVRPDIVIRSRGRAVLVADTKWKVPREGAPADTDLQQMFVYNELLHAPQAMLIYPDPGGGIGSMQGQYAMRDHQCTTLRLGLFDGPKWSADAMRAEVRRVLDDLATQAA